MLYYHWLVFCNQFTDVATVGTWNPSPPSVVSGTDGVINSLATSLFTAGSGPFLAIHATNGWYLAIRDEANPVNTTIARITGFINPTSVQLNAGPTNFTVSSTGVHYRIIDPAALPGLGDYFVIQNPAPTQPWQAKITCRSLAPLTTTIEFAPIGGWNTLSSLWNLPVCAPVYLYPTLVQSFMFADPDQGWVFLMTEETGGSGSNRKGCWFGALAPFHAPNASGIPSDIYYGAIFGDQVGVVSHNISRDTGTPTNLCVGQVMHSDTSIVPLYFAQKRFFGSGTDTNTLAGTTNPRTSESDDYDVIAFQKSTVQAFRGRVPGLRLLSNNLTNRSLVQSGTYVIGSGLGITWNGKPPVL